MAEESEKRFHAVMDKLFQTPPKSKLPATSFWICIFIFQIAAAVKNTSDPKSTFKVAERLRNLSDLSGETQASPCRPWDRVDYFRRLASFKSMCCTTTPPSPVPTPPTLQPLLTLTSSTRDLFQLSLDKILFLSIFDGWTTVDKAALVFSLKLDSGHKLLCPWVDNACDEKLAAFPPMPTAVLVDEYKSRCSALVQLVALPVISSSIVNCLGSTRLEEFLKTSSAVESGRSTETSREDDLGNQPKSTLSLTYYQAQKLISLCGWEPRALPYVVDSKDQLNQSAKDNKHGYLSQFSGQNHGITILSSNENSGANDDIQTSDGAIYDPNSVALECQICGARVGLWAFSTVQRPLEFLRLSGYMDINSENAADNRMGGALGNLILSNDNRDNSKEGTANTALAVSTILNERPNLNITIAGGPLPASQNYRAKISLPVVGQNIRARFSTDSEISGGLTAEDSLLVGKGQNISLDEQNNAEQEISDTTKSDPITEKQSEDTQMVAQVSSEVGKLPDHADDVEIVDPVVADHSTSQTGDDLGSIREGGDTSHQGKTTEHNGLEVGTYNSKQAIKQGDSKDDGVQSTVQNRGVVPTIASAIASRCIYFYSSSDQWYMHIGSYKKRKATKTLQEVPLDKGTEFDPIRLHKHFCPWIASSSGSAPGWQQTLSALECHKEFSHPLTGDAPSSSLIKVDDPVASVKRLFTPTPSKRKKLIQSS
nr:Nuclear-interacting partner of ALK like [Ipomoea batatas]